MDAGEIVALAVEKLGDLVLYETSLPSQVRRDAEWLRAELTWMQSFIRDAAAYRRSGDERIKNWVRQIYDVAHQAEDAVDIFLLRQHRLRRGLFFRRFACAPFDLVSLHHVAAELAAVKSKVVAIRESREAYGVVGLGGDGDDELDGKDVALNARRQSSPHLDDDAIIVGFDEHQQLILNLLLDANTPRRAVVSVVGMGGLGKTTLATMVYNSAEVKSHFNTCAWVTVSQSCRPIELLKSITRRAMGTVVSARLETMEEDEIESCLYDFLKQTRYLVVLDDVWAPEVWERIKAAFPNARNGSRVLLTTRLMDVARSADPATPPYELPFLTEQQSWELFVKKVFPFQLICPLELEELGQELVRRCGGLPLAVVVLGGLLSLEEPGIRSWLEVAENMEWDSTKDGQQCLQILGLSYSHLPHHYLKSCFLYLGCFPEDYPMKTSEIVKLWIAEGFVPQRGKQTLEETARSYMDELIRRCMVQVVARSTTTRRVKWLRIHDLVHDLCVSEAREDNFFRVCTNNADHEIAAARRLVIISDRAFSEDFHYSDCRARTVLGFGSKTANKKILTGILHGFFKLLRVIHLHCPPEVEFHKSMLPKEISSLIHLRHITLRTRRLWYLPSSIGDLQNLQTLNVKETSIYILPKSLFKIQALRHVRTADAFSVNSPSIGNLKNLQTLETVKAGKWMQRDLENLSSLRKLAMSEVSVEFGAALSVLVPKLIHLASLSLTTHQTVPATTLFSTLPNHQHLHKLALVGSWTAIRQLPQNLIKLSLVRSKLDQDAIAALERLPSLAHLDMDACDLSDQGMVFSSGGFPRLQSLRVSHMNNLKRWRIDGSAMQNLTDLTIVDCMQLMMLPAGMENLSGLKNLVVRGFRPELMNRLNSMGADRHRIEHIPSFVIDPTNGEL